MWPFSTAYPERRAEDLAGQEYDYIVVGGGTAGCVVASRLSEDPSVRVLLVERGRAGDGLLAKMPMASQGEHPGAQRLNRETQPIASLGGRTLKAYTSESLGGASRINSMLWNRGVPGVYNEWAESLGLSTWSWRQVEPFFVKAENARHQPHARHRGHEGPMQITQHEPLFEVQPYFGEAASSLGLVTEHDANNPDVSASAYLYHDYAIMESGDRGSTYIAYLPKPVALARKDRLIVCTGAIVAKLELDGANRKATGVRVRDVKTKKEVTVKARREVIVSNGAVRTPQLLMLSGIGDPKKLEVQGVRTEKSLPGVGAKLFDHSAFPVEVEVPVADSMHRLLNDPLFAIWQIILFIVWRVGWMSTSGTPTSIWVNSSCVDDSTATVKAKPGDKELDSSRPENNPDIEIMFFGVSATGHTTRRMGRHTLHTTIVRPQSHGHLELASTNPEDDMVMHYGILSDPSGADYAAGRKALRLALHVAELFQASSYRHKTRLASAPKALLLPTSDAPRDWRDLTDEDLDEYLREVAASALHFSCSCPIGPEAAGGVVDEQLRVHGFDNLRVADASVFPKIPSCHTMGPTVIVGERCADFVKKTWASSKP